MAIWHSGIIIKIEAIAPEVRIFSIEVQEMDAFVFKPGQFVTLDLPISDKRLKRWRSYSIASAPNSNVIDLCIVRNPSGLGTNWLFDVATLGTLLTFKGPDGAFVLPKDTDTKLVMICTGTGIAPFRSMLAAMSAGTVPTRPVHLIFGTRYASGLLYADEMEHIRYTLPDFEYDAALSREDQVIDGFYSGYLHQIYQKAYAPAQPDIKFMLCGWTQMIDQAVFNLTEMGYVRDQIAYELYG
jgi:ferredoxin-NADP reductase